jgi:hypothetical protein
VRQRQEGRAPPLEDSPGPAFRPDDLGQDILVPPVSCLLPGDLQAGVSYMV